MLLKRHARRALRGLDRLDSTETFTAYEERGTAYGTVQTRAHVLADGDWGYHAYRYKQIDDFYIDCQRRVYGPTATARPRSRRGSSFPATSTATVKALVVTNGEPWTGNLAGAALAGACAGPLLSSPRRRRCLRDVPPRPSSGSSRRTVLRRRRVLERVVGGRTPQDREARPDGRARQRRPLRDRGAGREARGLQRTRGRSHRRRRLPRRPRLVLRRASPSSPIAAQDRVGRSCSRARTTRAGSDARRAQGDRHQEGLHHRRNRARCHRRWRSRSRSGASRVSRIAGIDRYETALKVAHHGVAIPGAGLTWSNARRRRPGDAGTGALACGVAQGQAGSVLLFTPGTKLYSGAATEIAERASGYRQGARVRQLQRDRTPRAHRRSPSSCARSDATSGLLRALPQGHRGAARRRAARGADAWRAPAHFGRVVLRSARERLPRAAVVAHRVARAPDARPRSRRRPPTSSTTRCARSRGRSTSAPTARSRSTRPASTTRCATRSSPRCASKTRSPTGSPSSRGRRPNVDTAEPDLLINVVVRADKAVISIDLSGPKLHQRGYREPGIQVEAPIKENLAAAVLARRGVARDRRSRRCVLRPDVRLGHARDRGRAHRRRHRAGPDAPPLGLHEVARPRRGAVGAAARRGRRPPRSRAGHAAADRRLRLRPARARGRESAIRRAGLEGHITLAEQTVAELEAVEGAGDVPGLVATNPPYGERIGSRAGLPVLYAELAASLRARLRRLGARGHHAATATSSGASACRSSASTPSTTAASKRREGVQSRRAACGRGRVRGRCTRGGRRRAAPSRFRSRGRAAKRPGPPARTRRGAVRRRRRRPHGSWTTPQSHSRTACARPCATPRSGRARTASPAIASTTPTCPTTPWPSTSTTAPVATRASVGRTSPSTRRRPRSTRRRRSRASTTCSRSRRRSSAWTSATCS